MKKGTCDKKQSESKSACRFGNGFLVIGVYTETKAFPVCDAEITIYRSDDPSVIRTIARTDERGFSPAVALTVGEKRASEISEKVSLYDFFDVTIRKGGFCEVDIKRLPVFDGVISVRQCEMPAANQI